MLETDSSALTSEDQSTYWVGLDWTGHEWTEMGSFSKSAFGDLFSALLGFPRGGMIPLATATFSSMLENEFNSSLRMETNQLTGPVTGIPQGWAEFDGAVSRYS